jgi:hypothetical protein
MDSLLYRYCNSYHNETLTLLFLIRVPRPKLHIRSGIVATINHTTASIRSLLARFFRNDETKCLTRRLNSKACSVT